MHLVRHHGPERRFVYSGAKQLRAVMALHQRDLFRGRRPADFLARSAELIRCSGALAARRVGNVFNDRAFADVFLRHLMQTGGRMHMTMNRVQCDIQLQGCQLGHTLPEQPKTMWPVAESRRPQSRRLGVKVRTFRRPPISGRLPRAKRGRHHEDRGQRVAVVARLPVVVVSISSGRRAGHVPSPEEVRGRASHHGSAGSRMLRRLVRKFNVSFPSEVWPDVDALHPFRGERNRQFTGDEVFFHDRLYRASLPRWRFDAAVTSMKSAEVWSGLAEWIRALAAVATLCPEGMKNKHSRKGKSRLRLLVAAATFQRCQWYLNNARLRSTVACQQAALLGTGTCANEALHAELRGVFRQAYNVSLPTFRLKLDLFMLSEAGVFRRRPTYPVAPAR